MQQLSLVPCCSSTQQKFSSMPWLSLGVHGIASEPFRSGQIARLAGRRRRDGLFWSRSRAHLCSSTVSSCLVLNTMTASMSTALQLLTLLNRALQLLLGLPSSEPQCCKDRTRHGVASMT